VYGAAKSAAAIGAGSALLALLLARPDNALRTSQDARESSGCVACHAGIEDMHPEARLTCVDCHGGNASARQELEAHVPRPATRGNDERVAALDDDLAWRRFENPMDLRVVDRTCGTCHAGEVERVLTSLHATTAGHLSDGYYEVGASATRVPPFSVFPRDEAPVPGGEVEKLVQVPPFRDDLPREEIATHYGDLARKECMQCHLWSEGRAVQGRVGFDGDYRGEGCAACHVAYALDGLSASSDVRAARGAPGHPLRHEMTRAPTTQACTTCHYGDASIGLDFRGLAQLPPNVPGGPNVAGTTDQQLNRAFYLRDPSICPPDLHHERGMHCIDCHTQNDVMGDGRLHGHMEHAVEITCQACHGTFTEPATLRTERGTPLEHLRWEGEKLVLTSKVDGRRHDVPQAVHVLDPERPEFNERARAAMTSEHAGIQCYTCHAGWNPNLLGFHFSRQEALTQLDLLAGKKTPGRVTTQEKVFATWKSFYAGLDEGGRVAPYLTGFSTMGSVWDASGTRILDQVLPVTAAGLSGMTMIHHQPHTTRPTARSCVECHRAPSTWGLGSPNFHLGRPLAFVADRRGIEIVAIQREEPTLSVPLLKLPLPDVVALALRVDPLQGRASVLFAAEAGRGVHALDVSDPLRPARLSFVATVAPQSLELSGDVLYVADGEGGVALLDVSDPAAPELAARFPTVDAHEIDVQWPWMYVADGAGGLVIADVTVPIAPRFLAGVDLDGAGTETNRAVAVESLFQYSRPKAEEDVAIDERTAARNLCAVLDRKLGPFLIDVTEPTRPRVLFPEPAGRTRSERLPDTDYRGLVLLTQIDPAEPQGGERTAERDYVYVLFERGPPEVRRSTLRAIDVSDPTRARWFAGDRNPIPMGDATTGLAAGDFYNPPFRQRLFFAPGEAGVYVSDFTTTREPTLIGTLPGLGDAFAFALEEFPLDRMVDEQGMPLKDVSHEGSRWLRRSEFERILSVDAAALGLVREDEPWIEPPAWTARLHLERADVDRSGFLEGAEYEPGGGTASDADSDGRISLRELAQEPDLPGAAPRGEEAPPEAAVSRVGPDGDLARLLDGTDPLAFDANHDSRLERGDAERAFFAALDLDRDGALSPDEHSRDPAARRGGGVGGTAAAFSARDRNEDGRLAPREFRLEEAEWTALDADGDGRMQLAPLDRASRRGRGAQPAVSEWPTRRRALVPLPPGITSARLLERFDRDRDGSLARDDLLALADRDGDSLATRDELEALVTIVANGGVDACPDDFWGRWDLDASDRIEAGELPDIARLRLERSLHR
jgi:hypothetical protein